MVSLDEIHASNARIAAALPPLVAVFVGATSGIGENSLKQFAAHVREPRVYFVGRSQEAGNRITAECKALNAKGQYIFVKADTSLIRNVDAVCEDIKTKEKFINILLLSTGTLVPGEKTAEGLHRAAALAIHSRVRFVTKLLPLLQAAPSLRRVVSVFTATKEGPINTSDFQGWKLPLMQQRGHGASMMTFSLEALARTAPDVSFIHDFPGHVKSNLARDAHGALFSAVKFVYGLIGPMLYVAPVECGDRHVYLATSGRYPAASGGAAVAGVPLVKGVSVARGTDGKEGSGVYSVDAQCESADPAVEQLLAQMRKEGMVEKVWGHVDGEFTRIEAMKSE